MRECARRDEAIHLSYNVAQRKMDCFAPLAMTNLIDPHPRRLPK